MSDWTSEELLRFAAADEPELASLRADDSWRTPVTIWAVRHGEDLYVRSVNGPDAACALTIGRITSPAARGTTPRLVPQ